jgi:uncharacterized integral membrane protein (TIGR00697 family)
MSEGALTGRVSLVALFVAALVTGQVLAVKVVLLPTPVPFPVTGGIVAPAGVLAYALTFFATDCTAELYGRRTATHLVRVGFAALVAVMLPLVGVAILLPGMGGPGLVDPAAFNTVLAFSPNIIVGGLVAYLFSQHWDVFAFHRIREATGGERLWLRNVGSTLTSQAIDTVVFITLAFLLIPVLRGGEPSSLSFVGALIAGQYLLKLLIAVADTPFVYATVGLLRDRGYAPADPP